MKLFLASSIKNEKTVATLKDFVPNISTIKMVYIPTASNAEDYFGSWKREGKTTYNITRSLIPDLEVMELEFISDEDAQAKVNSAELLFMAGGFPGYLSYWLHRRKLVELIKQKLDSGMIYVGISAGAMVCGPSVKLSTFFENDPFAEIVPGLGIIDYEIWPHFEDSHKNKLNEKYPELNIKTLKDGEQIIIS